MNLLRLSLLGYSVLACSVQASESAVSEQLAAQQAEIQALKAKMAQLEKLVRTQERIIRQLQLQSIKSLQTDIPRPSAPQPQKTEQTVQVLKEETEKELHIGAIHLGGFFDVIAHTRKDHQPKFQFGTFELDLEYHYDPFSINAALDWEGDEVSVGTGVVDFHLFGHRTPPRGPIFFQKAVHLQAGRFDVPFGNDYQFFASPDRVTLTAPLTTELVQNGGFNSDGVRIYGTWGGGDFAGYWIDSLYDSGGTSAGGRMGIGLREFRVYRPYKPARPRMRELSAGLSGVVDWDEEDHVANVVYGADFNIKAEWLQLRGEWIWRDEQQSGIDEDQAAWHLTLIGELAPWFNWPLRPYVRYGRWSPRFNFIVVNGRSYAVRSTPRFTIGLNYTVHHHLALKLEYFTLLGTSDRHSQLPDERGMAQLVVNF